MMVFLTSIDILDTGFLTKTSRTTQVQASDRVNSGTALRLKGVDFNITTGANLDGGITPDNHDIIRDSGAEVHSLISINPTTFTIKLLVNTLNTDTSNYWGVDDMDLLADLFRLPHTRGWKAIYYPVDNTATDAGSNTSNRRDNQMIYQLGSADTTESQGDIDITIWTGTTSASSKDLTDVNYVAVRFNNCEMIQTPTNKLQITLSGVFTS